MPKCPRPNCSGDLVMKHDGDYITITCIACGRDTTDRYAPRRLAYELRMTPQPSEPRPDLKLAIKEPQLTKQLERFCDMRRRGHPDGAIRNPFGGPSHYPDLLLEEAIRRGMKGTNENPDDAFREWLLIAAALISCSSKPVPPQAQPTETMSTATNPTAMTETAEAPVEQTTA